MIPVYDASMIDGFRPFSPSVATLVSITLQHIQSNGQNQNDATEHNTTPHNKGSVRNLERIPLNGSAAISCIACC
jgi:hypothetical protein